MIRTSYILLFSLLTPLLGLCQNFKLRTYYGNDSTQLKEIISLSLKDSVLNGPYISYHQNGAPLASGYYKNAIPDSSWIYYFQNGKEKANGFFHKGQQTGTWTYYYENGTKKAEGYLDKGIKNGFWTNYYENEQVKNEGSYWDDLKNGIWNYFYEDGSVKAQAYYENGKGTYSEFYTNGSIKSTGQNENDKSIGEWKFYWETGEIQAEGNYKDGVRDGLWKFYHKNGNLSAEGKYEKGNRVGLWKYYHETGILKSQGVLEEDKKQGQWKLYYESGEIQGIGLFDSGDGNMREYYPSGKLKAEGNMLNGKKEGVWTYFNENGVKDGEATYQGDQGEYLGFYENGSIKMKGNLEGNKRVGTWTLFDVNGNVVGTYKPIYEDEKPIFRILDDEPQPEQKTSSEIPEYKYKSKSSRYFDGRINEYRGVIIGTNPVWMLAGQLPISLEYYMQERLGYEIEYRIYKNPYFKDFESLPTGELYRSGNGLTFRQKFYSVESQYGMLYFGHELRFNRIEHSFNFLNQTVLPFRIDKISAVETTAGYGLLVGWRWMKSAGNAGFASDVFMGFNAGFRNWEKLYEDPALDSFFSAINKGKLYLPLVIGVNIGWAGPKQKNKNE